MLTMLLGGLWHGASWAFVVWGGLNGLFLAVSKWSGEWRTAQYERLGIPNWLRKTGAIIITFHLACLTWVFFRASISDAWTILTSVARPWGAPYLAESTLLYAGIGMAVLAVAHYVQEYRGGAREIIKGWPLPARWAIWYALIFGIVLLGVDGGSQFLYFQF